MVGAMSPPTAVLGRHCQKRKTCLVLITRLRAACRGKRKPGEAFDISVLWACMLGIDGGSVEQLETAERRDEEERPSPAAKRCRASRDFLWHPPSYLVQAAATHKLPSAHRPSMRIQSTHFCLCEWAPSCAPLINKACCRPPFAAQIFRCLRAPANQAFILLSLRRSQPVVNRPIATISRGPSA